eukprot:11124069-Ditylum_brightwellii.AAC.1
MAQHKEHNYNNQSIMSGTTKQSNTEACQLAYTAKETHRKGSTSKNGIKDSKSAISTFSLRNLSIQKGSTQRIIKSHTDATNSSKDKNTTILGADYDIQAQIDKVLTDLREQTKGHFWKKNM